MQAFYKNHPLPKELVPTDPRFGCGPTLIPVSSLEKLQQYSPQLIGTSHRKAPVIDLVGDIAQNFRTYFQLPKGYEVLLMNGGATMLFDMLPLGLGHSASAHFVCGEFSQKWYECTKRIPHLRTELFATSFGEGITPRAVNGVDLICLTLNETSTGVQVDAIPDARTTDALVCVDATSGAGQIAVDMQRIDVFFFSLQKVFAAEGGMVAVFLSPKAIERISEKKSSFHYIPAFFQWKEYVDYARKNQTPNTPSLINLLLLRQHLEEMNALGAEEIYRRAEKKSELIYGWAEEKEYLSPFVKETQYRSRSVATIDLDEGTNVTAMLEELEAKGLVYGIDGYRKLQRNQLRVALFHFIALEDLERLTKLISYIVEKKL